MQKSPLSIKRVASSALALQITSMADIFIIILVFLLKSYATGSITINPSSGLELPRAKSGGDQVEALKIEISARAVQVEDVVAVALQNFRFPQTDLQSNGVSTSLEEALKLKRKRQELIAKSNSDVQLDNKILVVADQRTPYVTLKSVMVSAAVHGFVDLKLVVMKPQ